LQKELGNLVIRLFIKNISCCPNIVGTPCPVNLLNGRGTLTVQR